MKKITLIILLSVSKIYCENTQLEVMTYSEASKITEEVPKQGKDLEILMSVLDNLKISIPDSGGEIYSAEMLVPFIAVVCKNYDKKITPIILDRALEEDNKYLVRRLIYCLEKIEGKTIEEHLDLKFKDYRNSKWAEKLLAASSINVFSKLDGKGIPENVVFPRDFYLEPIGLPRGGVFKGFFRDE